MRIHFFINGEPFKFFDENARLHRVGHLIQQCERENIDYRVWTSNFYHQKKVFFTETNQNFIITNSIGYKKNISIRRFFDNFLLAFSTFNALKKFNFKKNDIIVCAFPIPEISFAVTFFAKSKNIPVIIDLRDLWPQVFYNLTNNKFILFFLKLIFLYQEIINKYVFKNSKAIFSITDQFMNYGLKYARRKKNKFDSIFYLAYTNPKNTKLPINNKFNFPKNKIIISFFGVISKKKFDFTSLFSVVEQLSKKNIHFLICGDGDDLDEFRNLNIKNLEFLGWLNQDEICYVAENSDYGLAHYKPTIDFQSSIPNKIIEYLSYGLPIIHCLKGYTKNFLSSLNIDHYYEYNDLKSLKSVILRTNKKEKILKKNIIKKIFINNFNADNVYLDYLNKVKKILNA